MVMMVISWMTNAGSRLELYLFLFKTLNVFLTHRKQAGSWKRLPIESGEGSVDVVVPDHDRARREPRMRIPNTSTLTRSAWNGHRRAGLPLKSLIANGCVRVPRQNPLTIRTILIYFSETNEIWMIFKRKKKKTRINSGISPSSTIKNKPEDLTVLFIYSSTWTQNWYVVNTEKKTIDKRSRKKTVEDRPSRSLVGSSDAGLLGSLATIELCLSLVGQLVIGARTQVVQTQQHPRRVGQECACDQQVQGYLKTSTLHIISWESSSKVW